LPRLPLSLSPARHPAQVNEIRIDWATYNPVSIVIKQQGLLEKEFEKDNIKVRWVQSAGSNKALGRSRPERSPPSRSCSRA
jgi:sulfonate transport system substrate-binding protein